MGIYTYFILGIVLGFALAVVIGINRSEEFENIVKMERKLFCTKKLDNVIENATNRIANKIKEKKADITEAEKNEIIAQCCKEEFEI